MERESFEDEQVAALLNQHYVSIKVDREERPDIDHVYMMYCQALVGQGGWPLTVIMTPDGHPFFTGTYFPKTSRYGRPGLLDILSQLHTRWVEDGEKLRAASEDISKRMQPMFASAPALFDPKSAIVRAVERLWQRFDAEYGGFADAPKFPSFHQLLYLLRYHRFTGDAEVLHMVEKTLQSMAQGGIYDHVGGGFSRYSTDMFWRVPHFEKMLYDNALAALTYIEAFQQTHDERYKQIVLSVLNYVIREMTSPDGAFYTAEDADSQGQEGRFYVWRPAEIYQLLGQDAGALYCSFYDITEEGNFEGDNIPNFIDVDAEKFARQRNMTQDELWTKLADCNERLYEWRQQRDHPAVDDKILTAWNAMMILAFAKAGAVFDQLDFVGHAVRALAFIEDKLVSEHGRLLARYRDGEAGIFGFADDYAYLIWAYLELYQVTLDVFYLQRAIHWQTEMDALFWDTEEGGYFLSGQDAEQLIATPKTAYDGATPSANSVAANNLMRLYAITGNADYATRVDQLLNTFGEMLNEAPTEHLFLLLAGMLMTVGSTEVVLVDDANQAKTSLTEPFAHRWHKLFLPEAVLTTTDARPNEREVYQQIENTFTVYVCRNFQCDRPETNWHAVLERIVENAPRLFST